jgi:hypothetical protein
MKVILSSGSLRRGKEAVAQLRRSLSLSLRERLEALDDMADLAAALSRARADGKLRSSAAAADVGYQDLAHVLVMRNGLSQATIDCYSECVSAPSSIYV